jgi:hypothetical protein
LRVLKLTAAAASLAGLANGLARLLAGGRLVLELDVGRTISPLGPLSIRIRAPRETVFDVIASPYLGRTPRALEAKLHVIERGSDMVLAAHFTPVRRFVATTVETVRFEPPAVVHFRLVRGPVPHVTEQFVLHEVDGGTELSYHGEIGADLWAIGRWWSRRVAWVWEETVANSLEDIKREAERRAEPNTPERTSR